MNRRTESLVACGEGTSDCISIALASSLLGSKKTWERPHAEVISTAVTAGKLTTWASEFTFTPLGPS